MSQSQRDERHRAPFSGHRSPRFPRGTRIAHDRAVGKNTIPQQVKPSVHPEFDGVQ
ncbi:hypothetical protein FM113_05670 [Leucobacter sp. 7(1)]|nr:hypothetical protein FM113_05670 [Leucobacter sp. 7(1)]